MQRIRYSGWLVSHVLWLYLALPVLAQNRPIIQVDVNRQSIISGETYRLGDMAAVSGNDPAVSEEIRRLSFGVAPQPGASYKINRSLVSSRLRKYEADYDIRLHVPEDALISRKSIRVKASQIERLVLSNLQQNPYATGSNYRPVSPIEDVLLPDGKITFKVTDIVNGKKTPIISYRVDFLVNGQPGKTVNYTFRSADASKGVVQPAAEPTTQQNDARQNNDALFYSLRGQQKSNQAPRNNPVPTYETKPDSGGDVIIRSGNRIRIVFNSGSIRLTAEGIAAESGRKGELISVVNVDSQKTVIGQITDSTTVVVL